ncbi:hypothetical protein STEG23_030243, partial [Scotinomys teguina]
NSGTLDDGKIPTIFQGSVLDILTLLDLVCSSMLLTLSSSISSSSAEIHPDEDSEPSSLRKQDQLRIWRDFEFLELQPKPCKQIIRESYGITMDLDLEGLGKPYRGAVCIVSFEAIGRFSLRCLWRPGEDIRSSGARVLGGCKLPDVDAGTKLWSPKRISLHLPLWQPQQLLTELSFPLCWAAAHHLSSGKRQAVVYEVPVKRDAGQHQLLIGFCRGFHGQI